MATTRHIELEQGSTFVLQLCFENEAGEAMNLGDYDARMRVKDDYNAGADTVLEASIAAGSMVWNKEEAGTLDIEIAAADSSAVEVRGSVRQCVYDIEVESPTGQVTQLYRGYFDIRENITA